MAQDQLKAILGYVKDVLGVESFSIAPASAGGPHPQAPAASKPYLFIGSYAGIQSAIAEMQTRMVAALKLNIDDFDFLNIEQTNVQPDALSAAQVIVVFGEEAQSVLSFTDLKLGEMKLNDSQKIIFTHSLTDLVSSAPMKKETWTHLQSVF